MVLSLNLKTKKRKQVYITADETGDPGSSYPGGRYYILAGCVVEDIDRFKDVSRKYSKKMDGEEVKFHLDENYRESIIDEAEPYVSSVYYTLHRKDPKVHNDSKWGKANKKALHKEMLNKLANQIIKDHDADVFIVDIDESSLISNEDAEAAFEENPFVKEFGSTCKARAENSKYNPGLQTNDFFVGSIGYYYNTPITPKPKVANDAYIKKFSKKLKRVYNRRSS